MSSNERVLHPADLIIARKALKQILADRESILSLARVQKQDLEFWNRGIWSWHNDVPRDRFYYFGIGTDPKRIDPEVQYSAMITWIESEIERVEKVLVQFYMEHERG